jgi:hypothetical protein
LPSASLLTPLLPAPLKTDSAVLPPLSMVATVLPFVGIQEWGRRRGQVGSIGRRTAADQ